MLKLYICQYDMVVLENDLFIQLLKEHSTFFGNRLILQLP